MGIFSIFTLIYIVYVIRAAQILWRIGREWSLLKQDPLSPDKKCLAGQAAFFIAVPPSVIAHELFHALAIWAFGGRVIDYGFAFYGGYVVPDRLFGTQQEWVISIAGTVGSLVFGIGLWWVFRGSPSKTFRFFGLRSFRMQVLLALAFYPLLALTGFGDWVTIYDFSTTPLLSGVTAVAHAFCLLLFYLADRRGWFEMAGFETAAAQAQFAELQSQRALNPQDRQLTRRYIDGLWRGDAPHQARAQLTRYLQQYPDDADAYALLAGFETGKSGHVSAKSKANAEKALHLGVTDPHQKALVYRLLGEYALERNQYAAAMDHFSQVIATLSGALNKAQPQAAYQRQLAHAYSRRSLVYRRQNNFDLAYEDGEQALALAQAVGDDGRAQHYRQELDIIQNHARRPLGTSYNVPSDKDVV